MEGKHSKNNSLPSLEDIKDGLLKMILFTNLEDVKIDNKKYNSVAVLKLSVEDHFSKNNLSNSPKEVFLILQKEAKENHFELRIL